jgi:hypothetical protein
MLRDVLSACSRLEYLTADNCYERRQSPEYERRLPMRDTLPASGPSMYLAAVSETSGRIGFTIWEPRIPEGARLYVGSQTALHSYEIRIILLGREWRVPRLGLLVSSDLKGGD